MHGAMSVSGKMFSHELSIAQKGVHLQQILGLAFIGFGDVE